MSQLNANVVIDAKGLACPMPIVKTKKEMKNLEPGQVVEVQATDKGSKADIQAWAKSAGHQYLGTIEEGEVLKHYVRKSTTAEEKGEIKHPQISDNKNLEQKLNANEDIVVIDVREAAEYAFNHIPNTINIPLGELEGRVAELNKNDEIYIICRTGNRSDLASRQLTKLGFKKVFNVVPGISEWTGETTSIKK